MAKMNMQEFADYVNQRFDETYDKHIALWTVVRQILFTAGATEHDRRDLLKSSITGAIANIATSEIAPAARRDRIVEHMRSLVEAMEYDDRPDGEGTRSTLSVIEGGLKD